MRSFVVTLSVALLAMSAFASSPITMQLEKVPRTGEYLKGSPDANCCRAAFLKSRKACESITVPATSTQFVVYTTRVGVGSPPKYYNLIVDTGSSNTFFGAGNTSYVPTSTSILTGNVVSVDYQVASFTGLEYLDQVTLGPGLVLANQSIGDAVHSVNFQGFDGALGVGPVDLTRGTLSPDKNATIPTVMNNLVSQGLIKNQVLGVHFAPSTSQNATNGALTYGGADPSLYQGELTYTPVTKTYPSSSYWGINVTSSTYGNYTIIANSTAGIIDLGVTQILLADDYFALYMDAIPGAMLDPATGLIEIPPCSASSLQPLNFVIADRVFTIDAAAQQIPTDQNAAWGGTAGKQYGIVGPMRNHSGEGLDFVLGMKFVERYYTVFDADEQRVGFAETNHFFVSYKG